MGYFLQTKQFLSQIGVNAPSASAVAFRKSQAKCRSRWHERPFRRRHKRLSISGRRPPDHWPPCIAPHPHQPPSMSQRCACTGQRPPSRRTRSDGQSRRQGHSRPPDHGGVDARNAEALAVNFNRVAIDDRSHTDICGAMAVVFAGLSIVVAAVRIHYLHPAFLAKRLNWPAALDRGAELVDALAEGI